MSYTCIHAWHRMTETLDGRVMELRCCRCGQKFTLKNYTSKRELKFGQDDHRHGTYVHASVPILVG